MGRRASLVMRRPSSTIASNEISSYTDRPRALIFGMKQCLMILYQVYSVMYKTIYVINIIIYMCSQHSNVL